MGSRELKEVLAKLAGPRRKPSPSAPELAPGCAFGYVADQRLQALEANIREIKGRINGLIFVVVGAVAVEIILGLVK